MDYLLVAIGGGLGAILRFSLGKWIVERLGASFPYGTFVINITGSFLLGFTLFMGEGIHLFFNMGFLGAFTTFSTFSYEGFTLMEKGQYVRSILYVIGSAFLGIVGAYLGMEVYLW
ncbi:MAG TPA: fluoride efflux transporter CrcB [Paenibacillaceae bacterium]|nr:fluoride efflux transporter CrcB [Paenibacillaceae bacterium]